MISIRAVHRFLPVGQGLFVSGSVEFWPVPPVGHRNIHYRGRPPRKAAGSYRWVYDCGTSSGNHLVSNAIDRLRAISGGARLDLLTLSHFHNDHISGVVELLKKVGAGTVMLPWAPLWYRLVIGFDQGMTSGDLEMLFYIDPVAYLEQAAGDGFDRVVFVMPSNDRGPPFLIDPPGPFPFPDGFEARAKDEGPGEPASLDELELSGGRMPSRVRTMRPGQSIPVFQGLWEFVPYNDPATRPADPYGFAKIVEGYRKDLLAGDDDARDQALKDLRKHYEATFGRGAMNNVSLMLYGGAVGPWHQVRYSEKHYVRFRQVSCQSDYHAQNAKGAILLTGDGVLNAAKKWHDLEDYLDAKRVTRTAVFQVAHHGARANWYDGLAVRAVPRTSVFSSDPAHSYGHPHAEVLRDFWSFHPVQVDQHSGYSTHIVLKR